MLAYSVDSDKMLRSVASDLGLNYLHNALKHVSALLLLLLLFYVHGKHLRSCRDGQLT